MKVLEKGHKLNISEYSFDITFDLDNLDLNILLCSNKRIKELIQENTSTCGGIKEILPGPSRKLKINLDYLKPDIDEIIFIISSDTAISKKIKFQMSDFSAVAEISGRNFLLFRIYKYNLLWKINYICEATSYNFDDYLKATYDFKYEKIQKPKDTTDIKNKLINLAQKIIRTKEQINSEEATKTAFILPFIQNLGYDIFNPVEVQPDIGTKKGEKVDYAITLNQKQVMIIECKSLRENLDIHKSQLHRYFGVSQAKIACLTNGINYRFYTDLQEINKMDFEPFLQFNILDLNDQEIKSISLMSKKNFDTENILKFAKQIKLSQESEYIQLR